jgi:hypothetical protein
VQLARRGGWGVWAIRVASVIMLLVGVVVALRKYGETPEQVELRRYMTLAVPVFLSEMADVGARFDDLSRAGGPGPAEARARLVDELMPRLVRLRKRAGDVEAKTAAVRAGNDELLTVLDRWLEACRGGIRAIDDPALAGEEGFRRVRADRRAADDAAREWVTHLRERCEKAGLHVVVPRGPGGIGP